MIKTFPAKLLLFGEYSVLAGSDACAFPLDLFSGSLALPGSKDIISESLAASNVNIKLLAAYLTEPDNLRTAAEILDLDRLAADIGAGLAFQSDIPQNYGVGSSGALVAAIFNAYQKKDRASDIQSLRTHLAFIESAFHSTSSGTDPLVSYLRKPVFISKGKVTCPDLTLKEVRRHISIDLIDSGIPGATLTGIETFQSDFIQKTAEKHFFEREYIPLINSLTNDILSSSYDGLMDKVFRVSEMQLQLFPHLFTKGMSALAREGIDSGEFAIKLCGSGGGGFYLKICAARL